MRRGYARGVITRTRYEMRLLLHICYIAVLLDLKSKKTAKKRGKSYQLCIALGTDHSKGSDSRDIEANGRFHRRAREEKLKKCTRFRM